MVRLAATVMLVRPADRAPLEVFMLRRSQASHFVPDAYVFPGGTVDASDMLPETIARTRGLSEVDLAREFRAQIASSLPVSHRELEPQERAGLVVAALRELFEEAGVLLACDAAGNALSASRLNEHRDALGRSRARLHAGEIAFHDVLAELDAYADGSAPALFSQWITPPVYPNRYDAHFFLALAEPDAAATADAYETHDGIWIAPKDALDRCNSGTLRMVYPTIKHIERLAQFPSAQAALDFARTKTIYRIMPRTTGEHEFALPPDLEYAW